MLDVRFKVLYLGKRPVLGGIFLIEGQRFIYHIAYYFFLHLLISFL